jgi:hypothetical protein
LILGLKKTPFFVPDFPPSDQDIKCFGWTSQSQAATQELIRIKRTVIIQIKDLKDLGSAQDPAG